VTIVELSVPIEDNPSEPIRPRGAEIRPDHLQRALAEAGHELEPFDIVLLWTGAEAWAAHRVGIEREYCQIEKLHNLAALPGATGFTVSCLPVKVAGASAGWSRAVAVADGP
jgi:kynurenine formamidase